MTINGHILLPDLADWGTPPAARLVWQGVEAAAITGAEKRRAMRAAPRLTQSWSVATHDALSAAAFSARLREALKNVKACAPRWGRSTELTAQASAAANTLSIDNADAWPWNAGDFLLLHNGSRTAPAWETAEILSSSGDGLTLTLTAGLASDWGNETQVWPLVFGRLSAERAALNTGASSSQRLTLTEESAGGHHNAHGASSYLTRPVFPLAINWADGVSVSHEYVWNPRDFGFGAGAIEAHQAHLTRGFELALQLEPAQILEADNFLADRLGAMLGFWLPGPTQPFLISESVNATQFKIADQGLADTWQDHPAKYLQLDNGTTKAEAAITAVADNGDGTETVTVSPAPGFTLDDSVSVVALHFVRLAGNEDVGEWIAEGLQRRRMILAELPQEYTAAETGERPIYLYHFTRTLGGATTHWRQTSFGADVASNGETFAAASITHGEINQDTEADSESVTLQCAWSSGHPLDFGFPNPPEAPLQVTIYETTFADPDTVAAIFTGVIETTPRSGRHITATAGAGLDRARARIPAPTLGPRCAFHLYDANTCGVARSAFEVSGATVGTVTGNVIRVTHATDFNAVAAQHFAFGWIEVGAGASMERRGILQDTVVSSTERELTLTYPLANLGAGAAATVLPGCDGEWDTCQNKFGNSNAMLQPFVPARNPTIDAVQTPTNQGGKK